MYSYTASRCCLLADTGEVKTLTLASQDFNYICTTNRHNNLKNNPHSFNVPLLEVLPAGDANTVYAMLIKVLNAYNIPMDKVIGICSDGASTMQGHT
jgi:hypothetical protein